MGRGGAGGGAGHRDRRRPPPGPLAAAPTLASIEASATAAAYPARSVVGSLASAPAGVWQRSPDPSRRYPGAESDAERRRASPGVRRRQGSAGRWPMANRPQQPPGVPPRPRNSRPAGRPPPWATRGGGVSHRDRRGEHDRPPTGPWGTEKEQAEANPSAAPGQARACIPHPTQPSGTPAVGGTRPASRAGGPARA